MSHRPAHTHGAHGRTTHARPVDAVFSHVCRTAPARPPATRTRDDAGARAEWFRVTVHALHLLLGPCPCNYLQGPSELTFSPGTFSPALPWIFILLWVSLSQKYRLPSVATSARSRLRHARDMQVPYELKQSPIAGLGLFATAPIARGTLLWKYDGNSVKEYEEAALRLRLAPLSAAEAVELCEHVFCWEGKVCEIVDDGKYWNHAKGSNQNTGNHPDGDAHGDGMSSYALRDIAAGEELTDDYALYDKLPWFEAICQEREVTGSCTEVGRQFD